MNVDLQYLETGQRLEQSNGQSGQVVIAQVQFLESGLSHGECADWDVSEPIVCHRPAWALGSHIKI